VAIRENKVTSLQPKQHTTEPSYHGSDIALGITMQYALDERRSVVAQTHVIRDCPPKELDAVLSKLADAFDRVGNRYRLRELRKLHQQRIKAAADMMLDAANTEQKWGRAWVEGGRKGEFKPDGNQRTMRDNWHKAQEQAKNDVRMLEVEIAALEPASGV
jgi:hypothetical protein